jgi:hypothetical protein
VTPLVELIHTLAVCVLAGSMIGWLAWWHQNHGPDKEQR